MMPTEMTDAQWASLERRLLTHTDRSAGPDGCWIYLRHIHKKAGYGRIQLAGGFVTQASRAAYILHTRELLPDPKVCVLHRCDNRKCCNPAHLFLGSRADNKADAIAKGRPDNKGERNGNAKFTPDIILAIRQLAAEGLSDGAIAKRFNTRGATVNKIRRRQRWSHIT